MEPAWFQEQVDVFIKWMQKIEQEKKASEAIIKAFNHGILPELTHVEGFLRGPHGVRYQIIDQVCVCKHLRSQHTPAGCCAKDAFLETDRRCCECSEFHYSGLVVKEQEEKHETPPH